MTEDAFKAAFFVFCCGVLVLQSLAAVLVARFERGFVVLVFVGRFRPLLHQSRDRYRSWLVLARRMDGTAVCEQAVQHVVGTGHQSVPCVFVAMIFRHDPPREGT